MYLAFHIVKEDSFAHFSLTSNHSTQPSFATNIIGLLSYISLCKSQDTNLLPNLIYLSNTILLNLMRKVKPLTSLSCLLKVTNMNLYLWTVSVFYRISHGISPLQCHRYQRLSWLYSLNWANHIFHLKIYCIEANGFTLNSLKFEWAIQKLTNFARGFPQLVSCCGKNWSFFKNPNTSHNSVTS